MNKLQIYEKLDRQLKKRGVSGATIKLVRARLEKYIKNLKKSSSISLETTLQRFVKSRR